MASKEGHPAYRSQSDNPLQGTTLGGSPDDPRRQRTRNAPAGHATRAGTRQRQRGLPGAGDLAHPVLPVAEALRALWGRRRASEAAARAPWAPGAGAARDRTVGAQRGDQHGDLGLRADRGVPHPWLAAQSRAEHGAAGFAASRLGHASRAADGARAPGGSDGRAADRAHAPAAVARALRADAPRRGHRAGGAGLSGHLLHRQSQGGRQGVADHGLRRRELLWRGGAAADPHGGRCRGVFARRPRAALSTGGVCPAARPDTFHARLGRRQGMTSWNALGQSKCQHRFEPGHASRVAAYHLDPLRDPRWGKFLESHPRASVFHTPAWLEALRRTYGYESVVYTTTPPGIELTNGMVLCRVYSPITGRRVVSLPFSDHCEPLVERSEDLESLIHSLELDSLSERWEYFEVRPQTALAIPPSRLEPAQAFYLHSLDLTRGIKDIFRRLHKDSVQRKIRRAEREGLTYEEGRSEALLDKFYRLLLRTRRRQHQPPHPRGWYRNVVNCLGDKIKLRIASKAGDPIASIVTLSFKDVLVYKYGCSDERFHNLGGIQLLLWNALQDGERSGAREFDLGRSDCDNSGLITFKDRWGAARSQLNYWRYPARLAAVTAPGWKARTAKRISPHIPDSLLIKAWRTTMVKEISSHIPDSLLIAVSKLLYKHMG